MSGCSRGIGQKHPSSFVRIIKFITKSMLVAALYTTFGTLVASAGWVNYEGKIQYISTYTQTDHIIFFMEGSVPYSHCTIANTFAISPTVALDRRQQMLSVLMTAQATNRTVTIAFDDTGCVPWTSGTATYFYPYKLTLHNN